MAAAPTEFQPEIHAGTVGNLCGCFSSDNSGRHTGTGLDRVQYCADGTFRDQHAVYRVYDLCRSVRAGWRGAFRAEKLRKVLKNHAL